MRRDSSGRWGVKPSQSPVPKHRRISQLASQDSRRFSSAPPSVVEGDSTAHNTQGRQLAHDNSGYQGGQYSLEPGFRHQGAQHRNPDVQVYLQVLFEFLRFLKFIIFLPYIIIPGSLPHAFDGGNIHLLYLHCILGHSPKC